MHKTIALSNGRSLVAGYSAALKPSMKWIVYIPESGAGFHRGSRNELAAILGPSRAAQYNFLVVNKTGIGPRKTDSELFEKSFRRRLRIQDAITAMKTVIPRRHEIVLLGYSEGAYLAPQVARLDKRVKAIVMIGGGTRGWLREELNNSPQGREKAALARQIREIQSRPRSAEKWNGFSFATWNSYREDSTLKALRLLTIPSLAILGARDRTIDLKSALTDLTALAAKKPIHTRVLRSCGHSFSGHWPYAYLEIREFLTALDESV